jgi:hypothetical protein
MRTSAIRFGSGRRIPHRQNMVRCESTCRRAAGPRHRLGHVPRRKVALIPSPACGGGRSAFPCSGVTIPCPRAKNSLRLGEKFPALPWTGIRGVCRKSLQIRASAHSTTGCNRFQKNPCRILCQQGIRRIMHEHAIAGVACAGAISRRRNPPPPRRRKGGLRGANPPTRRTASRKIHSLVGQALGACHRAGPPGRLWPARSASPGRTR